MIYTVGHSNHPIERFTDLLRLQAVGALADVRSTPYSRFNPQFNRERLQRALADAGIRYVFLGEQLGARSQDPTCYDADGRVSYARLAMTELFQRGLASLRTGIEGRVALMCAEREPLDCHRTILIARALDRSGIPIGHILADGSLEEHTHAMQRLVAHLKLDADLFSEPADVIERAYELQASRIAYRRSDATPKPAGLK